MARLETGPPPAPVAPRAPPSSWLARSFPALAVRDFRLIWSTSFASFAGWWTTQLALGWIVLELTNSPFQLGLVTFFNLIPTLVFSIPGGVLADRLDRRRLIVVTQAATALVTFLLALAVLADVASVEHLYVASLLSGVLMSLNLPARQALVVELVPREQMLSAIALNSAMFNVTRIVGPVAAGFMLIYLGNGGTLVVGAVCYLFVVFAVLAIRYRPAERVRTGASAWQNLVEGLRYTRRHAEILAILVLVAIPTMLAMPYTALLPAFARNELALDPSGLGLLNSAIGLGALCMTTFLATRGDRLRRKGRLLIAGTLLFGLLLIGFSQARTLPVALAFLALIGVCSFGQMTLTNSLLQLMVPNVLRGRVMSLYMLVWGLMPVGTIPMSALAERAGTPLGIALGGVVTVAATLAFVLRSHALRELD